MNERLELRNMLEDAISTNTFVHPGVAKFRNSSDRAVREISKLIAASGDEDCLPAVLHLQPPSNADEAHRLAVNAVRFLETDRDYSWPDGIPFERTYSVLVAFLVTSFALLPFAIGFGTISVKVIALTLSAILFLLVVRLYAKEKNARRIRLETVGHLESWPFTADEVALADCRTERDTR